MDATWNEPAWYTDGPNQLCAHCRSGDPHTIEEHVDKVGAAGDPIDGWIAGLRGPRGEVVDGLNGDRPDVSTPLDPAKWDRSVEPGKLDALHAAALAAPLDPARAALVDGLRALADVYAATPDLPTPGWPTFDYVVHADADDQGAAEVARIAELIGRPVSSTDAAVRTERHFGPVRFRVFYSTRSAMSRHYALYSYAGAVSASTPAGTLDPSQ